MAEKRESYLSEEMDKIMSKSTKRVRLSNRHKFVVGRNNLACTVFVPWDCHMNCPFCNTKQEYSKLGGIGFDNVLLGITTVRSSKPYLDGDIKEWVITGGEPFDDMDKLYKLVKFMPQDKPIYINTMLPKPLDSAQRKKLLGILRYVKGINVSRHLGNNLDDSDIEWLANRHKVYVRINCVLEDKDCKDKKALKKKIAEHVERYKGICSYINFRADYTTIKTIDDLKGLNNTVVEALCDMYEYVGDGGCDVCNDNRFLTKDDKFPVHYHRGLESTLLRLPNKQYVVNDVIVKPNGEILLDWNMDLGKDLELVAEYMRHNEEDDDEDDMSDILGEKKSAKSKASSSRSSSSGGCGSGGCGRPRTIKVGCGWMSVDEYRRLRSRESYGGGCGSVHFRGRPAGCGGDFDTSYSCGRPRSVKVGCGWMTVYDSSCSRSGSCGGGC